MKIIAIALLSFSLIASAQTSPVPPPPAETPMQVQLHSQIDAINKDQENLFLKLQNITEFQLYFSNEKKLQQLGLQYNASGTKPPVPDAKTDKPAPTAPVVPVKPETKAAPVAKPTDMIDPPTPTSVRQIALLEQAT